MKLCLWTRTQLSGGKEKVFIIHLFSVLLVRILKWSSLVFLLSTKDSHRHRCHLTRQVNKSDCAVIEQIYLENTATSLSENQVTECVPQGRLACFVPLLLRSVAITRCSCILKPTCLSQGRPSLTHRGLLALSYLHSKEGMPFRAPSSACPRV